ncbi:maleylacetate reductase [Actinomycetes bacterium M1A6_2h]
MRFDHDTLPQRVLFAPNDARRAVAVAVGELGARRVMVIASPRDEETAHRIAGDIEVAAWHHEVVMHVPVAVADRARAVAADCGADALVCIGGGSATGLAKAVALTTGLPIVAVPTTYAGSEATNVWGLTDDGIKTTGVDARVLPVVVVYDASLTTSLPVQLTVSSSLNALAHCVDALWAPRVDPIDVMFATEAMRALRIGLSNVSDGREELLYGAYLAAVAFASAGSGLHHKICHVLGGTFDLPHAQTHAVVLPHVVAFNVPHAPEAATRIAAAFDADDPVAGVLGLYRRLDAPRALQDLGMPGDGIAQAAKAVVAAAPPNNPTPITEENITALLEAAWKGTDPS